MVRKSAHRPTGNQCTRILIEHQVPERFAVKVGRTYEQDGPGAAINQLYAGGWEVKILMIKGVQKLWIARSTTMTDKQLKRMLGGDNGDSIDV